MKRLASGTGACKGYKKTASETIPEAVFVERIIISA
jgi:hypothetical protein